MQDITQNYGKIPLKAYEVSDEEFDEILYVWESCVQVVDSIKPYCTGYPERQVIAYDGRADMIVQEIRFNHVARCITGPSEWKQVHLHRSSDPNVQHEKTVTGPYCWNYMLRILREYYGSNEKVIAILESCQVDKNEGLKQFHYLVDVDEGVIRRYDGCYYYDINGAHCDAICEMFPLAAEKISRLYAKRKRNPIYKSLVNYFVGMMKHYGFEGAYNWVVQRTTKLLYDAIDATSGVLIYANTDGFIVRSPLTLLEASKQLGKFKLEYSGTVYVYCDPNYAIIQTGDKLIGSCLNSVRNQIDLASGKVVHYKRAWKAIGVDKSGKEFGTYVAQDVVVEIKN